MRTLLSIVICGGIAIYLCTTDNLTNNQLIAAWLAITAAALIGVTNDDHR